MTAPNVFAEQIHRYCSDIAERAMTETQFRLITADVGALDPGMKGLVVAAMGYASAKTVERLLGTGVLHLDALVDAVARGCDSP